MNRDFLSRPAIAAVLIGALAFAALAFAADPQPADKTDSKDSAASAPQAAPDQQPADKPAPDAANPFADPNFPFGNPPYAARAYSYVAVAQFEALKAAWYYKYLYHRPSPAQVGNGVQALVPLSDLPAYPSEDAVISGVTSALLQQLFPTSVDQITLKAAEQRQAALLSGKASASDLRKVLIKAYAASPFVHVVDEGAIPATQHVRGSNHCHIGVFADRLHGRAIVISAIDNLVKGSAGQALQNFNLMFGFDETLGLEQLPLFA